MKIGMKKMVLVLVISSMGLTSLVAPAPGIQATVTTSKCNYELGEPVYFTLKNTGTTPIVSNIEIPWQIEKLVGGEWTTSYFTAVGPPGWTLYPGQSKTWKWGQCGPTPVVPPIKIDAGIYRAVVNISGNKWFAIFTIGDKDSDGLPDTVDGCPYSFGRICNNGCPIKYSYPNATVRTSKYNYNLGEPVYFTLKNTGTTPIVSNEGSPWWIEKLIGGEWVTPYIPPWTSQGWTLYPGQSKTWKWGQWSITDIKIDAGVYRAVVNISGNKWFAIFTIGDKDSDGLPDTVDGCSYSFGRICNKGCPI